MPESDHTTQPHVGVQAVVTRGGSVLLQQRSGVYGSGYWGLPGGHLEFGETFEAATRRELMEELGINAIALRQFKAANTAYKTTHYVQIGMEVLQFSGEPSNREPGKCAAIGFFRLSELPSPIFPPSLPFVRYLSERSGAPEPVTSLCIYLVSIDDDANRRRFVNYYLLGADEPALVIELGRQGEGRPRQKRVFLPSDVPDALSAIRADIKKRVAHGYAAYDCSGSYTLDVVRSLFPEGHDLVLRSIGLGPQEVVVQRPLF